MPTNASTPGSEMSYKEALHVFSSCGNALDCLDNYQQLVGLSSDSMAVCARACVYCMYYTNTFSLAALKTLFIYRGAPQEENNHNSMTEMLATWAQNVGPVGETLHWASEKFYFHIHSMLSMSLQELQAEFKQGSRMDVLSNGVMEVMFWVACFQPPVVIALGDSFWDLAKELVRLHVSDVDQLNFLFWGGVLPQTVIMLEAKQYPMDSMIPPIRTDITIQGIACSEAQDSLQDVRGESDGTVLQICSHSSLIFTASVRLSNLTVDQMEMSSVLTLHEVSMKFIGFEPDQPIIIMEGVKMCTAGCSVANYAKVHCNHFSVTGAMAGFIGYNIKELCLTGSHTHLESICFKTGFFFCDTALLLRDVASFIAAKQTFYENNVIFDMKVKGVCVVEDSLLARCDHMGEIMTSVNCPPTFIRLVTDPAISRLVQGEVEISPDHETVFVANSPRFFMCSSFNPEEV